ncbi:MAG TPA: aminomethyl-transferring glycine dehydrogenase subunit GcvPA [Armatimonadota bacterium]|nr:aminomethyl-transferring glycine dehydrogenase subunit GcvPA [Armatimonadota bacterium]
MSFIPHTDQDRAHMLASLGLSNMDELFEEVCAALPPGEVPDIPGSSESELSHELWDIARLNGRPDRTACFRGAGAYEHYIPAAISHLLSRGEFLTAYTPYQAEISQGTLQVMYEFQTMVCELLGLEVANASMYDGASALAEAALMSMRITRKHRLLVTEALHPHWLQVLRTYTANVDADIVAIPTEGGVTSADAVSSLLDDDTAAVIIQNPNVFGLIEPMREVGSLLADRSALFIAAAHPIALGLLTSPGEAGADIAVAEGQPLGIPLSYGGPYLGLFATRMEHVRQMPGRISGMSSDAAGRRGYVMTLQAREQHIRRERATSNICSNQALCALAATIYLALMGPAGFRAAAERSFAAAHELARELAALPGCSLAFDAPFFNEFVLDLPIPAEDVERDLWKHGIISGLPLGRWWPDRRNQMLFCATEIITEAAIHRLAAAMEEALP